ncbi:metal ABC transporter solute-binding protein, Zn/Mn family [Rathayibacter rathayi]|uniref:ABC transporter substrate-binding protein n=1 Tax=Rathayibacter rathayi TaxID=33887 RepID=A0ABX5ACE5_RATRA|nr:zinc ABC transporter substrate-binding protein [Rathayibacter rathayi]PPF77053.1 ABC transporter substrate-binding protein [Rathayibacter rathayi]PPG12061.1 ABC transporter substrate-binding protein [Rathayibacter rathayi]PPG85778.1 ABC transporter substrate-binding protein [Rathayibacter rathayi]PPH32160.1 ABC transporter substrate-binding protein [Rathayibacter rathayi]PPH77690.1 ABC transporter substrate-binding protein [Rathayibacter rathayi]
MKTRLLALTALLGGAALALSGCSGSGTASATSGGPVKVVASTNVYGDLVSSIGGDLVEVTSIIDSPDKDPHEYEATARDQLAVSGATLVIENGGGYDHFLDIMISAAGTEAPVITATVIAGLEEVHDHAEKESEGGHEHAEFNEHVWYDLAAMKEVAGRIGDELAALDADNAATYSANVATLDERLDALIAREGELKGALSGRLIAITEPVPLYLTDALGLTDATPQAFSEAVEEGTDVPAATLQETLALFSGTSVDALIYNEQTEGAQTDAVLNAAKAAGIPTVGVTETLPEGDDYTGWMTANLDAIEGALSP